MTLEEAILKALSEEMKMPIDVICSRRRYVAVALARQLGYYLYRVVYNTPTPLSKCGETLFKLKQDHSTVLHAIEEAESHMQVERPVRLLAALLKEKIDSLLLQHARQELKLPLVEFVSISANMLISLQQFENVSNFRTNQRAS